jgi:TolB protein
MDSEGSNRRQLTPEEHSALVVAGSFSPDDTVLAFTRHEFSHANSNKADIYVVGTDGEDLHKLAERALDPAYSPDGTKIAFSSERDENGNFSYGHDSYFLAGELYVMDSDGDDPQRITETSGINESAPAWSSDGAQIAYRRGRNIFGGGENAAVFAVNRDGSCPTPILANLRGKPVRGSIVYRDYGAPAWSPGSRPGPLTC